ncbi:unnamed protein product [Microthlaspi erraticum]|uniref:RNA-binding S4 domain-containing protein n=1 Tax=Microthlaspi erraticum TaxID=1685480 RepID=A0A6D2HSI3_9BRAS|nr:unnamed protein product [Microthlaspi erraticum]
MSEKRFPSRKPLECMNGKSSIKGQQRRISVSPAQLIHSLADATTQNPKKKTKKRKHQPASTAASASASSSPASHSEPKLSKAARRFYNENIKEPPQRLSKVLAAAGVASRRTSEELIFDGKATVNGVLCTTQQTRVDPERDNIYVNGNRIPKKLPPKVYFALNKPKGFICSSGEKEIKSVISLFDEYMSSWTTTWGFPAMLPLSQLHDKDGGFLVNGELMIVAELDVYEVLGSYMHQRNLERHPSL